LVKKRALFLILFDTYRSFFLWFFGKNAIMKEMYVSGATLFTGVKNIEGTDWTDTYLRKDQQDYLCNHPTAKGINPVTGVSTRESLMCSD